MDRYLSLTRRCIHRGEPSKQALGWINKDDDRIVQVSNKSIEVATIVFDKFLAGLIIVLQYLTI
jgi:hypothetical protein